MKTSNYFSKKIVNILFNETWYNKIKLFKIILDYKLKVPYEISPILSKIITSDAIILDIGANMGQYACRLNKIVKKSNGMVYCFEPVKNNFVALASMKRILNLNKVVVNNYGISNAIGETYINIPIMDKSLVIGTQATLLELNNNIKIKKEAVKLTTIDTYITENNIDRVDFIKCDTEGNEVKVLDGGKSTISKQLPILDLEISHNNKNINWIYNLGYKPFYYDSHIKKLSILKTHQTGNLILIHEKMINQFKRIIDFE